MEPIAILGASGLISRGLITGLAGETSLILFSRQPGRVRVFLEEEGLRGADISVREFNTFPENSHPVVIHAAGPGDPGRIRRLGAEILHITEDLDNLVLRYMKEHPKTKTIYISTGAVYGNGYREAAGKDSCLQIPVNLVPPELYYPMAKAMAETKHRALSRRAISDIRVFGYLSPHFDSEGGYFLSEVAQCLLRKEVFKTHPRDFIRDYVGPLKNFFKNINPLIENLGFAEWAHVMISVIAGKHKVLPILYSARDGTKLIKKVPSIPSLLGSKELEGYIDLLAAYLSQQENKAIEVSRDCVENALLMYLESGKRARRQRRYREEQLRSFVSNILAKLKPYSWIDNAILKRRNSRFKKQTNKTTGYPFVDQAAKKQWKEIESYIIKYSLDNEKSARLYLENWHV